MVTAALLAYASPEVKRRFYWCSFVSICGLRLHGCAFAIAFLLSLAFSPALAKENISNLELARKLNQAFVEVVEKVSPVVVVINVVQKASDDEDDTRFDPLPHEYRRRGHPQFEDLLPEDLRTQGSGIIIREDGFILTNGHVVEDADKIEVRLQDGRIFPATIRGVDDKSDVAVLKIDAKALPVAKLADSAKTRVGEFAIAIGVPFNLDYSVTYGHVSAKGRSNIIPGDDGASMDQDFIQTDANINPGNSGGPLVNINGEVIGINTLIRGLHTGIGFAIPSSLAKEVSDQLIAAGKYPRPWLGIGIQSIRDLPVSHAATIGVEQGVLVSAILTNGPAYHSDLKTGDIITALDGKRVSTVQELRHEVRIKKIGQAVTLNILRPRETGKAEALKLKVKTDEWTEPQFARNRSPRNPATDAASASLGLTVHPITPEIAKHFGVETSQGIIVLEVRKGTLADRQGIKPGDVITGVDQRPVANTAQFHDALKNADPKTGVLLNLLSGKTARFEILKDAP
jgi:serine protease Do